jgi:predicted nuclease of predicted toxin-antitoxin system
VNFKLDENFSLRVRKLFAEAGHDVQTVRDEGLGGISDQDLFQVCCREQRCLVTLDLDFANVVRFPPGQATGIVVIRPARTPTVALLEPTFRTPQATCQEMRLVCPTYRVRTERVLGTLTHS